MPIAHVGSREHLIAVAKAVAENPCNCQEHCCDADDEEGVCIGLPKPLEPPIIPRLITMDRRARD